MSRRLRLLVWLGALALLSAGCKAQATVLVAVHPDGSGQVQVIVSLDAAAAVKAGDLSKVLDTADLHKAGWRVDGPGPGETVVARAPQLLHEREGALPDLAGAESVVLTHPFANVAQGNALLAEVTGVGGPLRGAVLSRSSSFSATHVAVRGTVDFSRGLEGLGDPALTKALGGRSLTQVATELNGGAAPARSDVLFTFFAVGEGFSFAPHGAALGISAHPGDRATSFAARGTDQHTAALLWAGLAILLLLVAVVVVVVPHLPGREPPPPAPRKRQLRSADEGWELVARRNPAADASPERPRGRHTRPRGQPPAWKE